MKRMLCLLAAPLALALLPAASFAQVTYRVGADPRLPSAVAPTMSLCFGTLGAVATCVDQANGLPTTPASAQSKACVITASPTAGTATDCNSSGSAGAYVFGPFTPQAGYAVRLVSTGTWAGSMAVGTSANNCATINPLTVAGQTWGNYTGNANEAVDVPPSTGGVAYCLSVTVSSGTLNAALRQ